MAFRTCWRSYFGALSVVGALAMLGATGAYSTTAPRPPPGMEFDQRLETILRDDTEPLFAPLRRDATDLLTRLHADPKYERAKRNYRRDREHYEHTSTYLLGSTIALTLLGAGLGITEELRLLTPASKSEPPPDG